MKPAAKVACAAAATAGLAAAYLFLCTAGSMTKFLVSESDQYARLAVAFVDGHTDLIERPDGTDTGDAAMRARYWDLSLFDGKLYLYWGPVPALVAAAVLWATALHLTDAHLTFGFALGRAIFGALVLAKAKRAFFPTLPAWPTVLGVVTLAFGAPLASVFARAVVYEAAIAGGQCFAVAGMYAAFVALTAPRGRARGVLLGCAGFCWALAIGCRLSLALACAALALCSLAAVLVQAPGSRSRTGTVLDGVRLGGPLGGALVLQGVYNRARFGSIWDTGLARQVTAFDYHSGLRYVVPNLYTYTLRPPRFEPRFPFVSLADWIGFPLESVVPGDIHFEANAGFVWSTPFYALAVVACVALARWVVGAARRRSLAIVAPRPLLAWFTASSLALATLGFAPCLVASGSTSRYLLDVTAGLAFSATVGLSLVVASPRLPAAGRRLVAAGATAMVVASVLVNAALWVGGPYGNHLKSRNARLFEALTHALGSAASPG